MAIEFKQVTYAGETPVLWRGEAKVLPGGFALDGNFAVGAIIKRGTPIFVDFDTMKAKVAKVAKVLEGGSTTKPRVVKGSLIQVGDKVGKIGGSVAATVKSIVTTNVDYDVIELSTAVTGLEAGNFLHESENGSTAVVALPNMVAAADVVVGENGVVAVDAAYQTLVRKDVAYPVDPEWLNGVVLKANSNIIYIKQ